MQNKQLWALIVGMGLVSGGALAQQPPRQESPEVTAAEMEAMKEAAAAGGTARLTVLAKPTANRLNANRMQ